MTEILFTLTTVFVAYVFYSIVNGQKTASPARAVVPPPVVVALAPMQTEVQPEKIAPPQAVVAAPVAVQPAPVQPEKIAKPQAVADVPVAVKVQKTVPAAALKGNVRDPKTGEVATVGNNYRFTKRWIKEALVSEGLLDRIYKNNELDSAAEATIKTALQALAAMDKYRA